MAKPVQSSTPGDNELGQVTDSDVKTEFVEDDQPVGDVVQYTGGASIRLITRREWEQAGVGRQQEITWTVENRHLVSVDQFTDAARERVLKEPDFRLVNAADVS